MKVGLLLAQKGAAAAAAYDIEGGIASASQAARSQSQSFCSAGNLK